MQWKAAVDGGGEFCFGIGNIIFYCVISNANYTHYYQQQGWKTAMVCADTFQAGAFD